MRYKERNIDMNENRDERDDELQRLRARQRNGSAAGTAGRNTAGRRRTPVSHQRPASSRNHDELDDAYYYEEEYGYTSSSASSRGGSKTRTQAGGRARSHSQAIPSSQETYTRQKGRRTGKKGKKRKLGFLLLLLLAAILAYGAWLFLHRPTGYWNVAVFGVDSRDGNTDRALADVQMICSIDRATGEIKLVSVYRDTYLKINSDGNYHKINEAYFKGGHKQAVDALEENLDIKIDDYATFNWKTVADAINVLGGIDLDISQSEFAYINSFITETVESTGIASVHLTQPGPNHLDGVQAVAYSRLRLMDTDFQRTERQRKVVTLALEKAKQADTSTLIALAKLVVSQISTSVGADDLLPMAKDVSRYHIGETAGFPFSRQTARVGKMDCVIPTTLESNVILLHQFLYGEDTVYQPSSAVKKISSHISEETGLYEEGKPAPASSGTSGSSGGSGAAAPAPAPQEAAPQPAPAETVPESAEESTEESLEESTEQAAIEEPEEKNGDGAEGGPGETQEQETEGSEKPGEHAGSTEGPGSSEGPGAAGETKPQNSGFEHPTPLPSPEELAGPGVS